MGTGTSWLPCRATSHCGLAAPCTLISASPRPCRLPTGFGDSPTPQQGTQGRSRAWLREPPARQAPGRGRTLEHQQQQINVPPGCDGAVMETVSWKPFPADGKPPLAPTAPQPAPRRGSTGTPTNPHLPRGMQPAMAWRGGGGKDACRIGPGRVGEGMDVARQPASSVAMATPPHPSWDAARPDDEVISGGERGRQAGRQRGPVGAWQAPKPAYRRHTLHPESRGRPCWTPPISTPGRADSSDDWHSASSARAVLAGAPKSPWCRAELSSPKLTASSQSLGDGNWGGGPYKQSNPQTKATAGPWELKNKGKAGGCLTGKGPPSTPLAPTTPEPPAASRR